MIEKDARMRTLNDLLAGIRVLKLYGWEASMERIVATVRRRELRILWNGRLLNALLAALSDAAPTLVGRRLCERVCKRPTRLGDSRLVLRPACRRWRSLDATIGVRLDLFVRCDQVTRRMARVGRQSSSTTLADFRACAYRR